MNKRPLRILYILYIAYTQHRLLYDLKLKDSTETLHRNAPLHRLAHGRWLHMLLFIFLLIFLFAQIRYNNRSSFESLLCINTDI